MGRRNVQFYALSFKKKEGRKNVRYDGSVPDLFHDIWQLRVRRSPDPCRYYVDYMPDLDLVMLLSHVGLDSVKGTLVYARRGGQLPEVMEENGTSSTISLRNGQAIKEAANFVFYFDNNYLGLEYNQFGPRHVSFCRYLTNKCSDISRVDYELLIRHDSLEFLRNINIATYIKMRVLPQRRDEDEESVRRGDIGDIMRTLQANNTYKSAALEIRADLQESREGLAGLFDSVKSVFSREKQYETFSSVTLGGIDFEGEEGKRNLLQDKLVFPVSIDQGLSVAEWQSRMWEAIDSAYSQIREVAEE